MSCESLSVARGEGRGRRDEALVSSSRELLVHDKYPPLCTLTMNEGSKKLINSVDTCVDECLKGLAAANPQLILHPKQRVLFDGTENKNRKVAVISGGGAGHEPFSTGYVGRGMLTAAISGSVFASPPSSHVLYAIHQAARVSSDGVLVLIPNYTGDILNFGLAVQLAKAEGIQVESLVVGEDIALVAHGIESRAGRRGMCGLVVLFKIAGSAAARGASLQEVKEIAAEALSNMASIGLGLNGCTLPGASAPLFQLAPDEMELGVGVHGEAGAKRLKLTSAQKVVEIFLNNIISHFGLSSGDQVAAFVNNLGGLSNLEQWLVAGEIHSQLEAKGIKVTRLYAGPIFTSINMVGVQMCCLRIPSSQKALWLSSLDEDTSAPSWPGRSASTPKPTPNFQEQVDTELRIPKRGLPACEATQTFIRTCLETVTLALIRSEEKLNDLDSGCGDGDCGTTLRHLAAGILKVLKADELTLSYPATLATELAEIAASTMGGTSGAIYSLFLTFASSELEKSQDLTDASTWACVWRAALNGVQQYSIARVGDRTMFDALEPACDIFEQEVSLGSSGRQALWSAVDAAIEGCERTRTMLAMAGRASYVDSTQLKEVDAGAYAVTQWLEGLLNAFSQ